MTRDPLPPQSDVLLINPSKAGADTDASRRRAARVPVGAFSRHVSLFTMGTTMWTAFFLVGLSSDYFLEWSAGAQLWLIVVIPTIVLFLIARERVRGMSARRAIGVACLTAFYFTAPFLAYDGIYLGIHKGMGWSFLKSHWFLTAFYLTPWLTLPFLAARVFRAQKAD